MQFSKFPVFPFILNLITYIYYRLLLFIVQVNSFHRNFLFEVAIKFSVSNSALCFLDFFKQEISKNPMLSPANIAFSGEITARNNASEFAIPLTNRYQQAIRCLDSRHINSVFWFQ